MEELEAAAKDPEAFLQSLGPLVASMAVTKLQPQLEPTLAKHGLTWEQAMPVLSQLTSIDRLHAAADDPEAFVSELLAESGPAAKAFAIAKLRPVVEPLLRKHNGVVSGLDWESLLPVLELVDSMEELEAAAKDPEAFLQSLPGIQAPEEEDLEVIRVVEEVPKLLP